jgi:inorganic pyrophosphatase
VLPAAAVKQLSASLAAASVHRHHLWRDTAPVNADGTINAYIEIPRGERRKFEFDMHANARAIDRVMPERIGGYPVNYGFVPQTVSYDGDPFDALVLGPPLPGGRIAPGVVIGLMFMEDEKGLDAKVVLSPLDGDGRAPYELTVGDRDSIGGFFRIYKQWEPGKFSRVPGWGTAADGRAHISMTHAFFRTCRASDGPCRVTG